MTFHAAYDTLRQAVDAATAAAIAPGEAPTPVAVQGLSDLSAEEMKRQLPGSVVELAGGTFE